MDYVIQKEDKYYVTFDAGNKITLTANKAHAQRFTYEKSQSIIGNQISLKDRHLYKASPLEETQNLNDIIKPIEVYKETIFDDGKFDFKKECLDFNKFLSELAQYKYNLEIQYKKIDSEKIDLEHYIEFYDMNASQGYKAYKMFQDIRRRRRVIKDNIRIVDDLLNAKLSDYVDGNVMKVFADLESRIYNPRILKELFE